MYRIPIYEQDSDADISVRAGMPVCMVLRMNGVLSTAWLKTAGYARIDENFDCRISEFACVNACVRAEIPEKTGYIPNDTDTVSTIAAGFSLPERIVSETLGKSGMIEGTGIFLPVRTQKMYIHTVGIGESWENFPDYETLMMLNHYFGPLYPGMKILVRG